MQVNKHQISNYASRFQIAITLMGPGLSLLFAIGPVAAQTVFAVDQIKRRHEIMQRYLQRPGCLLIQLRDEFDASKTGRTKFVRVFIPRSDDWISLQDAIILFGFVSDDSPSLRARNALSSFGFEPNPSTVGNEAGRMIEGCCHGRNPLMAPEAPELVVLKKKLLEKVAKEIELRMSKQSSVSSGRTASEEGQSFARKPGTLDYLPQQARISVEVKHNSLPVYKNSPVHLLARLRNEHRQKNKKSKMLLYTAPRGWLTFSNSLELFELVQNDSPCTAVIHHLKSDRVGKPSTVGIEARRLIAGFATGSYPRESLEPAESPKIESLKERFLAKLASDIDTRISERQKLPKARKVSDTNSLFHR